MWSLEGVAAQFDTKWVGWPGVDVCDEVGKKALSKSLAKMVRIWNLSIYIEKFVTNFTFPKKKKVTKH